MYDERVYLSDVSRCKRHRRDLHAARNYSSHDTPTEITTSRT